MKNRGYYKDTKSKVKNIENFVFIHVYISERLFLSIKLNFNMHTFFYVLQWQQIEIIEHDLFRI